MSVNHFSAAKLAAVKANVGRMRWLGANEEWVWVWSLIHWRPWVGGRPSFIWDPLSSESGPATTTTTTTIEFE